MVLDGTGNGGRRRGGRNTGSVSPEGGGRWYIGRKALVGRMGGGGIYREGSTSLSTPQTQYANTTKQI